MSDLLSATSALEYADYVTLLREKEPLLADAFACFTGIEHVLEWMQKCGLDKPPIDIVGQDEFSYDFLLQFDSEGRWLAFGVT
jgi:hypothetical protein